MGWMDRLIQKANTTAAVTGRSLSDQTMASAVEGGLKEDYKNRQFYANLSQQNTLANKSLEATKEYQNAVVNNANARLGLMEDELGFKKDQAQMSNIASAVSAIPTAYKYGNKIYDKISTMRMGYDEAGSAVSPAFSGQPAITAGDFGQTGAEAITSMSEYTPSAYTTAGEFGPATEPFSYAGGIFGDSAFGTTASKGVEASILAGGQGAGVATQISEAAVAAAYTTAGSMAEWGASTAAHEAGHLLALDAGWGAALGETAAMLTPFVPFVSGILMADGLFGLNIIKGASDVISDIGSAIGDVFSDIGDSSIICTELYREGEIDKRTLAITNLYRIKYIDDDVYKGYLKIFKPVVKLMKKYWIIRKIMKPLGMGFVKEMKHRMGRGDSSLIGRILIDYMSPVCRFIGKDKKETLAWTH